MASGNSSRCVCLVVIARSARPDHVSYSISNLLRSTNLLTELSRPFLASPFTELPPKVMDLLESATEGKPASFLVRSSMETVRPPERPLDVSVQRAIRSIFVIVIASQGIQAGTMSHNSKISTWSSANGTALGSGPVVAGVVRVFTREDSKCALHSRAEASLKSL